LAGLRPAEIRIIAVGSGSPRSTLSPASPWAGAVPGAISSAVAAVTTISSVAAIPTVTTIPTVAAVTTIPTVTAVTTIPAVAAVTTIPAVAARPATVSAGVATIAIRHALPVVLGVSPMAVDRQKGDLDGFGAWI